MPASASWAAAQKNVDQHRSSTRISRRTEFMPELLRLLAAAVASRSDVVVLDIVRRLGFDNMMYGVSTSARLDYESWSYVFTTFSQRWVARHDQKAYIELDTRIIRALDSALPLIWDYVPEREGASGATAEFFDDMLAKGVGSGVVCEMHGPHNTRVIVSLSHTSPSIDDARRDAISRNVAETMSFGTFFHEIFMKQGIPPSFQRAPLSRREKDCLVLAAHDQTTQDMALKTRNKRANSSVALRWDPQQVRSR